MNASKDRIENEIVDMLKHNGFLIALVAVDPENIVRSEVIELEQGSKETHTSVNRRFDVAESIIAYFNEYGFKFNSVKWNEVTRTLELVMDPNVMWFGSLMHYASTQRLAVAFDRILAEVKDIIHKAFDVLDEDDTMSWLTYFDILRSEKGGGWAYRGDDQGIGLIDGMPMKSILDHYITSTGLDWREDDRQAFCKDHDVAENDHTQPIVFLRDAFTTRVPDVVCGLPLDRFNAVLESVGLCATTETMAEAGFRSFLKIVKA